MPSLLIILDWPSLLIVTVLISVTKHLRNQLKGGRTYSASQLKGYSPSCGKVRYLGMASVAVGV